MRIHSVEKYIPSSFKVAYPRYTSLISEYSNFLNLHNTSVQLNNYNDYIRGNFNSDNYFYSLNEMFFNTSHSNEYTCNVMRYINDSAGTVDAIKCFFMLAYSDKVEVLIPRSILFKSSNTVHSKTRVYTVVSDSTSVLKITDTATNTTPFIEQQYNIPTGNTNTHVIMVNHTFVVDDNTVVQNNSVNTFIRHPYTPNLENCKNLSVGDYITVSDIYTVGEYKVTSLIVGEVTSVGIALSGINYNVGDAIRSTTGNGFYAVVSSVGVSGDILTIEVKNAGKFFDIPSLYILSGTGTGALVTVAQNSIGRVNTYEVVQPNISDAITSVSTSNKNSTVIVTELTRKPVVRNINLDTNNILSVNDFVIDSKNLHDNSYTIVTKTPLSLWKNTVDTHLNRYGNTYKVVYNLVEVLDTFNYPQQTAEVYV